MATPWFRVWSDMANDPKWRTIARISKQSIGNVIATYIHMLTCASNASLRGVTQGWCDEDVATALDIETSQVEAIRDAMQGRVRDGDYLTGWEKRQPVREDLGAADRVRRAREKKKEEHVGNGSVTQCYAVLRKDTIEEIREEEIREEQTTLSSGDDLRSCPTGSLVNLYHELMPNNPRAKVLNAARKSAIRSRWLEAAKLDCAPFGYETKSQGLEAWRRFFTVCAESKFLTGQVPGVQGKPAFVADVDFIFSAGGFAKTLENKYHRDSS